VGERQCDTSCSLANTEVLHDLIVKFTFLFVALHEFLFFVPMRNHDFLRILCLSYFTLSKIGKGFEVVVRIRKDLIFSCCARDSYLLIGFEVGLVTLSLALYLEARTLF